MKTSTHLALSKVKSTLLGGNRRLSTFFIVIITLLLVLQMVPSVSFAQTPSTDINTYVLFAYDHLNFKGRDCQCPDRGVISGGNVGVNSCSITNSRNLVFGGPVTMDDNTYAVGYLSSVASGSSIWGLFANQVDAGFTTAVLRNPIAPNGYVGYSCPLIAVVPGCPSFTAGGSDIEVLQGTSQTLIPGSYGNLKLDDNCTLTLSAGTYNFVSINAGKVVAINTTDGTVVNVEQTMLFNDNGTVGPSDLAQFNVCGSPNNGNTVSFSQNMQFHGQVLVPNGILNLGHASDCYGRFWADDIATDFNVSVHYRAPCSVTEPNLSTIAAATSATNCTAPNCDGSIDLTVTGNNSPVVSYNWSNGATTQDISGLCPTHYNVTVTLADGCTTKGGNLIVCLQNTPCAPTTTGDARCTPGVVNLSAFGCSDCITLTWYDHPMLTTGHIVNIGSTYSPSLTSSTTFYVSCTSASNGESARIPVTGTINEPTFVLSHSETPSTVCSAPGCNGSIDLTVTGNVAVITSYLWSDGETIQDISGLCPNSYSVTVNLADGCSATDGSSIGCKPGGCNISNVLLTDIHSYALFAYDELIFKGGNQAAGWGKISGNIGVNYAGKSSTGFALAFATSGFAEMSDGSQAVADNVRADATGSFYDLYANALNPSFAATIRHNGPIAFTPPIIATASLPVLPFTPCTRTSTQTAANLTVPQNGTFTFEPSPFAYDLVRVNDNAVVTFGDGTFDMRDFSLGKNVTVIVTDNTILQIDSTFSPNDGLLFGIGTNAGAKILVGACGLNVTTTRATNFSHGAEIHASYFSPTGWLDLGGGNNLYGTFWAERITGDPNNNVFGPGCTCFLTASATTTNTKCYGSCDGSAIITPSGGAPGYTITWDNEGVSGFNPGNLCAGTYCYTVNDAGGCSATNCITIINADSIHIDVKHTDLTCNELNGLCDGSITLSLSGGTSPYTIAWSDNLFGSTDLTQTSLCPDTYCYTVTDANGCTKAGCVTIGEPPLLLIASNCCPDQITCHNACNGKIDITVFGGVRPYTYSWSADNGFTSSDSDIFHLCPGTYTVTVTDHNGCTYDNTHAPITNPDSISVGLTSKRPTNCNSGSCNGSITVSPSGGTQPYTISWSTGETGVTSISGLCGSAKYKVTVTDQLGCATVDSIALPGCDCPVLKIDTAVNAVTCYGASNGSATISVSGGASPFTITWDNVSITGFTPSGLAPGKYCFTVKDLNGCPGHSCITIVQPDSLKITTSKMDVSCSVTPKCTGYTTYTQGGWGTDCKGGNPGCYRDAHFAISFPSGVTIGCTNKLVLTTSAAVDAFLPSGTTPSVLPAGTLTDPGNSYSNVFAGQLVALTLSVGFDTTKGSTHLKDLFYTGSGPFHSWTVEQILGEANKVIGGCPSLYTASDLNPVLDNINNNYDGGAVDKGYLNCSNSTSISGCNGSITVSVIGGSGGKTISWSNAGVTGFAPSGLCAGSYCFTITDVNLCSKSGCVSIGEPTPIISNISGVNPKSCIPGTCNGTVSVSPSGGTVPYTITWSTGASAPSVSGLCAAKYKVTISDANGCSIVDSVKLLTTNCDCPLVTNTHVDASCNGVCNGSVTIHIPHTGATPYSIAWSVTSTNAPTDTTLSKLCGGQYCYTVTFSALNCTQTGCVTINQPSLTVTVNKSNLSCSSACTGGSCDGTIALTITASGTPTVKWTGPNAFTSTSASLTKLCAGTYCYTVTNGTCSSSACVTLTQPKALTITVTGTNPKCNGYCNGAASVTVSSGDAPYTYSWSNGKTTANITSLCAATYCVTVTSASGCTASKCVCIAAPAALCLSICSTNASCNGSCNGAATVSVSGATSPYTYSWSNSATTAGISGLCGGQTYCVTVTSAGGCSAAKCVTISQPSAITVQISSANSSCSGSCDGTASATVTGGTGPFSYHWNNGACTSSICGLCASCYCVTVTSCGGCSASACVTVTEPKPICVTVTTSNATCQGGCNGSASASATGGNGVYTYKWSNGCTKSSVSSLCPGSYSVIVSSGGCCVTKCFTICQPSTVIKICTSETDASSKGNDGSACVTSANGGTAPYSFVWSNTKTTCCITCLKPGTYYVTVYDANRCSATTCVTVKQASGCGARTDNSDGSDASVTGNPEVNVYPNPFSTFTNIEFVLPNDDNSIVLEVYSVTGQRVAELYKGAVTAGIKNTFRFNSDNLPEATYFYRLVTSDKTMTGTLILTR